MRRCHKQNTQSSGQKKHSVTTLETKPQKMCNWEKLHTHHMPIISTLRCNNTKSPAWTVLNAAIRFVIAVIRWGHGKGRQVGMVALVIDSEPQFAKTGGNRRSGLPTLFHKPSSEVRLSRLSTYLLSSTDLHHSFFICLTSWSRYKLNQPTPESLPFVFIGFETADIK